MVATRCPKFIRATERCIARVDFPVPPFSLPTTMTCAEIARLALTCTNMPSTRYRRPLRDEETKQHGWRGVHPVIANPMLPSRRGRRARGTLAERVDAVNELAARSVRAVDGSGQRNLPVHARGLLALRLRARGLAGDQRIDR